MTRRSSQRCRVFPCLLAAVAACWLFTGVASAAPSNTTPPSITGTAQQGQTLTLHPGTWTDTLDPAVTVTDAWESCSGGTCSTVVATGTTYTIPLGDVGRTIQVVETASTATDGSATMTVSTAAVIALPPANTTPPSVTGIAQEGQTLTLTRGAWTNNPTTITDQWEDCTGTVCSPVAGQTGPTYLVSQTDIGHTIRVTETATTTGGTASASSTPTLLIVAPPTEIGAPSISGVAQQGSVLTEHHGSWTGSPTSFSYQWERCVAGCTAIPGALGPTYVPTVADLGAQILVLETAINAGGPSAPAGSALTGVVTTPAGVVPVPASISPPSVSGISRQGQRLVEAHGTWSGNPGSYQYQWASCSGFGCAPIPGATGQTYTPTAADVGQTIVVSETASNNGGNSAPAVSGPTATVTAVSSTSLVVSTTSPKTNQLVTLVATVSSSSGNATPAGSLTFFDGGSPISGCAGLRFGSTSSVVTVVCQSSFPAGGASLSAAYTPPGALPLEPSASVPIAVGVTRDLTATSLAVTKQVMRHNRATYTASVVLPISNSGPIQPTGSIEFLDRGRPIRGCRNLRLIKLTATCAVRYKSFGRHEISARYLGDANFASSSSPARPVQIVRHLSGPGVRGFISSTLQWVFHYHPAYTKVSAFAAEGVVTGTTIAITCTGGCPFSQLSFRPQAASMNLLQVFRGKRLRVGAEIIVRMTRPNWIGKYYSFTVRAGRGPLIVLSCLGVGKSLPGTGC